MNSICKKVISYAAAICVVGACAFAGVKIIESLSHRTDEQVYEATTVTELRVGKYYLENGTSDEYIEVYDNGTLQVFGYSYYDFWMEKFPEYYASLLEDTEEHYDAVMEYVEETDARWREPFYYNVNTMVDTVVIGDYADQDSGPCLMYVSEDSFVIDTLMIDDGYVYHYEET